MKLSQLKKLYCGKGEHLCEIKSKKQALNDIFSRTSCCWGAGTLIEGGWMRLAAPSGRNGHRTIFVCKASLVADNVVQAGVIYGNDVELYKNFWRKKA